MSLIERGILKEGDVLPPERELAKQFNVGRNALREAIKVLEIYGLVWNQRIERLKNYEQKKNRSAVGAEQILERFRPLCEGIKAGVIPPRWRRDMTKPAKNTICLW